MHFSSHHFLWWICPKHILLNFGLRKLPKLPTVGSTQKLYHRTERRAELVTWIASSERYAQLYQNNKHHSSSRHYYHPARWSTNPAIISGTMTNQQIQCGTRCLTSFLMATWTNCTSSSHRASLCSSMIQRTYLWWCLLGRFQQGTWQRPRKMVEWRNGMT